MGTIYDIWLDEQRGISPGKKREMIEAFGGSEHIFGASVKNSYECLGELKLDRSLIHAEHVQKSMERSKMKTVGILEDMYPAALRGINDPPILLYYRGDLSVLKEMCAAVVGARKVTRYGRWAANGIGRKLGEYQVTVVSGMAAGVDTWAHKGALEVKGKTAAVLGCGVDVCYPRGNQALMDQILEEGVIISEYPPGTPPKPYHFPMRNRIISGLSCCSIIVEAGLASGSLITAERAMEQGRDVYVVPGNIDSPASIGANKLIRDGALPLVVIDDLVEDLGLQRKRPAEELEYSLGRDEKKIYKGVAENGEVTVDFLCKITGKAASEVNAIVTILEIKGLVQTSFGKVFVAL